MSSSFFKVWTQGSF